MEIKKTRPAVVISNDLANQFSNRVQVLPITSNVDNIYPCECKILTKKISGKAMADQIMTVSKERLYKKLGSLKESEMLSVERIIKIQLNL